MQINIINKDHDSWTFTDTIRVYNWEQHPDWNKCPLRSSADFDSIKYYQKDKNLFPMIEAKRILGKTLGWDNDLKRNTFTPTKEWILSKSKYFPVKLSHNATNLYRIDWPYKMPVLTHSVDVPLNQSYVDIHGTWKIYYSGGSDTGSIYVDSIDIFKQKARECFKPFQMMYFPEVYINNPFPDEDMKNNSKENYIKSPAGIIYNNISTCKISIE